MLSIVQKVVRDLREFGVVQRAFLGVQLDAVAQGLRIASVRRSSARPSQQPKGPPRILEG